MSAALRPAKNALCGSEKIIDATSALSIDASLRIANWLFGNSEERRLTVGAYPGPIAIMSWHFFAANERRRFSRS